MNQKIFKILTSSILLAGLGIATSAEKALSNGITVTIEAPEIQSSQLPNSNEYFVVDFENQNGTNSFNVTNNNLFIQ